MSHKIACHKSSLWIQVCISPILMNKVCPFMSRIDHTCPTTSISGRCCERRSCPQYSQGPCERGMLCWIVGWMSLLILQPIQLATPKYRGVLSVRGRGYIEAPRTTSLSENLDFRFHVSSRLQQIPWHDQVTSVGSASGWRVPTNSQYQKAVRNELGLGLYRQSPISHASILRQACSSVESVHEIPSG